MNPAVRGARRKRAPLPLLEGRTPQAVLAAAYTAIALATGGGGTSEPLSETILEVVAALFAMAWLLVPDPIGRRRLSRPVLTLCGIVAILPAIQLIPLPPGLWHALPGQEDKIAALALIGKQDTWQPWTISATRTLAALLALAPPLLALVMISQLDRRERVWVVAAVFVMAFLSILLGTLQISAGRTGMWRLYSDHNLGFVNGFQANRNATADVLLIGLVSVPVIGRALIGRVGEDPARWLTVAACAALSLACALTASRTGIVLIPVAIAFAFAIWKQGSFGLRFAGGVAALLVALAGAAILAAGRNPALGRILSRFTLEGEFRYELWYDTLPAVARYFPFGSGMSTFRAAFLPGERLGVVDESWPVRAHNDYLELLLEGGIFAAALLACAIVVIARLAYAAHRNAAAGERGHVLFALATMVIIGLHSIVDYPMRSMALAHLMAVATGIVAAIAGATRRPAEPELEQA